jgi:hypothetical protein
MSLLASALVDSRLLSALAKAGDILDTDSGGVSAAAGLDVRKLALFAGFITMVRHNNDLFQHLPNTLRVLRLYGVELSVFRDHFLTTGRPVKHLAEKIDRALATLGWFAKSGKGARLVGLRDVLAHEEFHWRISQELANRHRSLGAACHGFSPSAIPQKAGPTHAARFLRAPEELTAALDLRKPLSRVAYRPHHRVYLGEVAAHAVRIVRVDRRACDLLALVDGQQTCAEILARVMRVGERPEAATAALLALANARIISFDNKALR